MTDVKPTKEFLLGADLPWEEVAPGMTRQIMGFDGKIMLVKVRFEPGPSARSTSTTTRR